MVGEAREYVLKKNEMERVLKRIKERFDFKEKEKKGNKINMEIYKIGNCNYGKFEITSERKEKEGTLRIKPKLFTSASQFFIGLLFIFIATMGYTDLCFISTTLFWIFGIIFTLMGVGGLIIHIIAENELSRIIDEARKKR